MQNVDGDKLAVLHAFKAEDVEHQPATVPIATAWPDAATSAYTVAVLTLSYTLAYLDRSVLGLLVEPIRADLSISDTQVSLLGGTAFAVFYVLMGLPMGWLTDHVNRRNLIAIGMLIWSCMTVAGGLAHTFGQLFFTRIWVGIGEATLTPAALSMISNSYSPARRQVPLGLYMSAVALGSGLAYVVGGGVIHWVSGVAGFSLPVIGPVTSWQVVFFVVGAPGVVLAALVLLIKEPKRRDVSRTLQSQGRPGGRQFRLVELLASYLCSMVARSCRCSSPLAG